MSDARRARAERRAALAIPRHLPSTPPPARRGTSSKHHPNTRPCGKTTAPQLPRSPQLVLRPARSAHPWRLELRSSRQTSSCATVPSTTSTKNGSTASPSSSAPQGALLHRPFRCTAPRPARATKLRRRPGRLLLKKAPWLQGAWPLGGTRSVRCQRGKSRAAKESLARKKLPGRSLLQHVATMLLLPHVGTCKTRLSVT